MDDDVYFCDYCGCEITEAEIDGDGLDDGICCSNCKWGMLEDEMWDEYQPLRAIARAIDE